jgi:FAD:protein FMN transferase
MGRALAAVCLSAAVLAGAAPQELHRYEAVEPHMGTLVRVTVYTPDEQTAKAAFRAAFDRVRALDGILSDYKPESELNRITKTAIGRAMPVSEDLFTVLRASQDLAGATDGAFDVTQGPVIQLWREARRTGRMPDAAALRDAASRSGFRKLHLDGHRRTVRCDTTGMARPMAVFVIRFNSLSGL